MVRIAANIMAAAFAVHISAAETSLVPYIPTTILIPGSTAGNIETAYIFTPNHSGSSVDFLSLDILTSDLNSSFVNSAAKTLTSGLPFVSSANSSTTTTTTSFTPTIALDGSIIVYAGDCTLDSGSEVWIYNASSISQSWIRHQVTADDDDGVTGPYFLGGAIAFSETIAPSISSPEIYSYGGQCPSSSQDGTTWISAADYTNSLVKLAPSSNGYSSEDLSLKSQPIAEAGFSITPLLPSTSNISGVVTQSINAVVLGGHTRTAFVNISTAAVWSLPEESWSFISISGPLSKNSSSSSSDQSELARADTVTQVSSRSGHTTVLNEDGTALVVLGGWVGNTSQAATPQLAVLEMNGNDYGEWIWTIPEEQPLDYGDGIYGHGAALLPGNIMMVAGGYSISSSSASTSRLGRRDDINVAGGQLKMFLNMTSMTWSNSYTNPLSSTSTAPTAGSGSSTTSTHSTKFELGLGLGLGIPLLLLLLAIVFFLVRRRRRHQHAVRDEHIRNLASGSAFITSEEMLERQHEKEYLWGPKGAARWYYTGGHDPYLREEKSLGYESLRGLHGAGFDFSEPMAVEPVGAYKTSLRRKPVPRIAKGLYQPTGVDESRALGAIHPILEDEEDEMSMHGAMSPDREMEGAEDDPFVTPYPSPAREATSGPRERNTVLYIKPSISPGPTSPTEPHTPHTPHTPVQPQHPEVQDWVTDIDASDALITARIQPHSTTTTTVRNLGRATPTRRLSLRGMEDDGGARTDSNLSESNRSTFSFMPNRADSLRVAAVTGSGLSTIVDEEKRGGTSHSDKSSSSNSNNSYMTAKSISALQAEGPGLLLGRPRAISDIEDLAHLSDDDHLAPGSPGKSKARRSWFGSIRRVFSNSYSSDSSSGRSIRTDSPAHAEGSEFDRLGLGNFGLGGIGLLQKRRQGRSAWDERGEASASGHGPNAGEGWEEEDWDVERAVEQRLVQVMFSVPKERLRIVNGDPEILSLAESAVVVDPESEDPDEILSPIEEEEKSSGKGKQRMEEKEEDRQTIPDDNIPSDSEVLTKKEGKQAKRPSILLNIPQFPRSEASDSPRVSPGIPMTAEEVRFERPRTKVLEMVEQLEERSRSSSPVRESPRPKGKGTLDFR